MSDFHALRRANVARQPEFGPDFAKVPLAFRGLEMGGEIGEVQDAVMALAAAGGRSMNVVKKLERERMGFAGSTVIVADLADELADVVISTDLVAMAAGIDLRASIERKFDKTSEKLAMRTRLGLDAAPTITLPANVFDMLLEALAAYQGEHVVVGHLIEAHDCQERPRHIALRMQGVRVVRHYDVNENVRKPDTQAARVMRTALRSLETQGWRVDA